MEEWDWPLNRDIDPSQLGENSPKKVWWRCARCGHSWEAKIVFRAKRGTGCPVCALKARDAKRISHTGTLDQTHPVLCSEWSYDLNTTLTPKDVSKNVRKRVWWRCSKNESHIWEAFVNNRALGGAGCPICKGKKATPETSLQALNQELATEWHPTLNQHLRPDQVRPHSHKKVWWRCRLNPNHDWSASIDSRTRGNGCPFCAGQKATTERNLKALHPDIMEEWDIEKNVGIDPEKILPASSRTVWWRCKRNPTHSWAAVISTRTRMGVGCPFCNSQTSTYELRVLTELRSIFPKALSRYKAGKDEVDIYLPEIGVAVEVDGAYWHKQKLKADREKNERLNSKKIQLIRLRQEPLKPISDLDLTFKNSGITLNDIKTLTGRIASTFEVDSRTARKIAVYAESTNWSNDSEYRELLETLPGPRLGTSLLEIRSDLAAEWHPAKNKNLKATDVAAKSNLPVWWQCRKNPEHVWRTTPNSRVGSGTGCPYCNSNRVSSTHNLQVKNPTLAAEWHPTKNALLGPEDVTPTSGNKVWWQCRANQAHEWQALVSNRAKGSGCPFCNGRRPISLSEQQILAWADSHHEKTGRWPTVRSGRVLDAPNESWSAINAALSLGIRGLTGGTSISKLLGRMRGEKDR